MSLPEEIYSQVEASLSFGEKSGVGRKPGSVVGNHSSRSAIAH